MGNKASKEPEISEEELIKKKQLEYLENLEKKKRVQREEVEANKRKSELGNIIIL